MSLLPSIVFLAAAIPVAASAGAGQGELVIYKEGSNLYHRPGCRVVRDSTGVLALTRAQAEARGFKPHADCDPANPKATPPPERGSAANSPVTVYVDGAKYYHRKTCPKLDPDSSSFKALTFEAAAKSHWPCPACKPPIFKRNSEPAVPGTGRRSGG